VVLRSSTALLKKNLKLIEKLLFVSIMELSVGNSFPNLDNILLEFGETLTKSNTSTLSATLLDNVLSGSFLDQILNRTSISRKRFPRSR